MFKRISLLSLSFLFLFALLFQSTIFAGFKFGPTPDDIGPPGTITIGDAPANPDPAKPVIVFVQGLTNNSSAWYLNNNMYDMARNAGFETVFVELYDSAGTPKSYWDNGLLLANMLEEISQMFNGKKLAIVGYSKGGVDTQAALIHYGKHHLVSEVVTIGSPHHGSDLADLAYSSWTWWLAALMGSRNEGTESLQTGHMNYFRQITDSRWEAYANNYYTIAGNYTGRLFSSTWWGGTMISGPSDGVVSVASATLPYGDMLAIGRWSHDTVHLGSNAFPIFNEYLTVGNGASSTSFTEVANDTTEAHNLFVRGGEQSGAVEETFHVEEEANKITVNWLSATKHEEVEVLRPGKTSVERIPVQAVQDTEFFKGAYHHQIEFTNPEAGEWKIGTYSDTDTAYSLIVTFDSELNHQLHVEESKNNREWTIGVKRGQGIANKPLDLFYQYQYTPEQAGPGNSSFGKGMREYQQSIRAARGSSVKVRDHGPGAYNTTIEIVGETAVGGKFQRTVIKSIFVDENGKAY